MFPLLLAVAAVGLRATSPAVWVRVESPPTMLFPASDTADAPKRTDSRNSRMATLLGALVDAADDSQRCAVLLDEATPMLLEPFRTLPQPGSVYEGCHTMSEKLTAYGRAMDARIEKAREGAGASAGASAGALTKMRDHVFAQILEGGEETNDAALRYHL